MRHGVLGSLGRGLESRSSYEASAGVLYRATRQLGRAATATMRPSKKEKAPH